MVILNVNIINAIISNGCINEHTGHALRGATSVEGKTRENEKMFFQQEKQGQEKQGKSPRVLAISCAEHIIRHCIPTSISDKQSTRDSRTRADNRREAMLT